MYIYFSIFLLLTITHVDVIGFKLSDNVATFISPVNRNIHYSDLFAKPRIRRGFPSDGKKFTLEDLIEQNILPQPPVFNNDPGYNKFHKINYKKLAHQRIKDEEQRIAKLDEYFNDSSKNYNLLELLDIFNRHGIYPYMSITKTIEMVNRFIHSINDYKSNSFLDDELIQKIHGNRSFLSIMGSIRRHLKILQRAVVRRDLLDDPNIKKSLPQFRNSDIVDIFELLSASKYKNDALVALLIKHVEDCLDNFTITQLCSIIYNITRLKYNSTKIVDNLTSRLKELNKITPLESLHISQALLSSDSTEKDIFDVLSLRILAGLDEFQIIDLVVLIKTFTSAEYINADFYSAVVKTIASKLDGLKSVSLIMDLLSSLSRMNIKNAHLLHFISSFIADSFSSFSPLQLASAAKYFATLEYYPNDLFERIFGLSVLSLIPDIEVMNQIRMGYHKNQSYTAYLHRYPLCELDKLYNKIFIAYTAYHLESPASDKFKFSEENESNLRDLFLYQSRERMFTSSSLHLEIADMYKTMFNITFQVGYPSEEGILVDLAYVKGGSKFAIRVNGPYSFMQQCLAEVPPPPTVSSIFKERLLKKSGWEVVNINYWDYATWFSLEKKKQVLLEVLPAGLRELAVT